MEKFLKILKKAVIWIIGSFIILLLIIFILQGLNKYSINRHNNNFHRMINDNITINQNDRIIKIDELNSFCEIQEHYLTKYLGPKEIAYVWANCPVVSTITKMSTEDFSDYFKSKGWVYQNKEYDNFHVPGGATVYLFTKEIYNITYMIKYPPGSDVIRLYILKF